jgi:hypothetical protein
MLKEEKGAPQGSAQSEFDKSQDRVVGEKSNNKIMTEVR